VVGVVDDIRKYKVAANDRVQLFKGDIYFPVAQGIIVPPEHLTLMIRTDENTDLAIVARELPAIVARINSSVPVTKVQSMDAVIYDSVAVPRSTMWLFASFAALALLLGAVGIYSLISYSVARRTREIGIRMALGARRVDVMRTILNQGWRLIGAGVITGLVGT